jgi:hypothetical protein
VTGHERNRIVRTLILIIVPLSLAIYLVVQVAGHIQALAAGLS